VELAKTNERTGGNTHIRNLTPAVFEMGFGFSLSQSRETDKSK